MPKVKPATPAIAPAGATDKNPRRLAQQRNVARYNQAREELGLMSATIWVPAASFARTVAAADVLCVEMFKQQLNDGDKIAIEAMSVRNLPLVDLQKSYDYFFRTVGIGCDDVLSAEAAQLAYDCYVLAHNEYADVYAVLMAAVKMGAGGKQEQRLRAEAFIASQTLKSAERAVHNLIASVFRARALAAVRKPAPKAIKAAPPAPKSR